MSPHIHVSFVLYKAKANKEGLCPLLLRLTFQGQRRQVVTGKRLSEQEWKRLNGKGALKDPRLLEIRAFMSTFETQVNRLAQSLALEDQLDLDTLVDRLENKRVSLGLLQLFRRHNEEMEQRASIDRSKATYAKYRYTYDKLKAFIKAQYAKNDLPVHLLESSVIQQFYNYLLLHDRLEHNTAAKYCKNLKRIMNYGKGLGLVKENPFQTFQIGYKDIDRTYLTATELKAIEEKIIPIARMATIRDLFLFQCYTGLSFSDMAQLEPKHLVEGIDGKPWLVGSRHKTGVRFAVPLLPPALRILERYRADSNSPKGGILPVLSNQKFNAYLKELAVLSGLTKNLTSHVGRRTFGTTVALGGGISMESIARMLGHKSIKMTSLYAVVTDLKLFTEMDALSRKLSS